MVTADIIWHELEEAGAAADIGRFISAVDMLIALKEITEHDIQNQRILARINFNERYGFLPVEPFIK